MCRTHSRDDNRYRDGSPRIARHDGPAAVGEREAALQLPASRARIPCPHPVPASHTRIPCPHPIPASRARILGIR